MPLFQSSVVKKFVNDLDIDKLDPAWRAFQNHFQNTVIQQNILQAKEEEYQEGFVRDLFVHVLGYTLKPQPDYNLVLEQKSTSDATKSDGAILREGLVSAVIELKDTGTIDLGKIEKQAFGYKHQHKECKYVITSNFQKLRLYVSDAIEFEEFDLFLLTRDRFKLLYCCLRQEALHDGLPLLMQQQSNLKEENITKKLYGDYSKFRKQLFNNIREQNPHVNPIDLFKKTQKLLDRFLFILFAEDRLLLPPNSVREILQQWQHLKDLDNYVPLYARFLKYFGYLDKGYQGKNYEIFAYNGGLFAPDDILDNLTVDDDILFASCTGLSNYDFESEVDVNILGHIFEHSLSEIELIEKELSQENNGVDPPAGKVVSKRKKDGVFYTPHYITKYIVENTVGTLCTQKKEELQLIEESFAPQKRKDSTQQLLQKLNDYRAWLLQLTICDPACGSGAFLNQALEFLIAEHRSVDELQARLFGDALVLHDIEASILENNLYGVDINEEATEIAKLSLWLRTARKGRKLNNLNKHIKCGNSLIDDPDVAGDKAFNWQEAFPQVFAKGGFDVVIGNPPYVRNELIGDNEKKHFARKFEIYSGKSDLYVYFFERSFSNLKNKGLCGFIVSSKFTKTKYGIPLINFLNTRSNIEVFIDFKDLDIFNGIVAYPSTIIFRKEFSKDFVTKALMIDALNAIEAEDFVFNFQNIHQLDLFKSLGSWNSTSSTELFNLFQRIKTTTKKLIEVHKRPQVGIKTGLNEIFIIQKSDIPQKLKGSKNMVPYVLGKEVKRYQKPIPKNLLLLPYKSESGKLKVVESIEELPNESTYLTENKSIISQRAIIKEGIISGSKKWYELQQIKTDFNYENYIIYPDISRGCNFTFAKDLYYDMTCFGIESSSLELLGVLNSKFILRYLEVTCVKAKGGYLRLKSQYLNNLPLPESISHAELAKHVERILFQIFEYQKNNQFFIDLIQSKFGQIKGHKLTNWPTLLFKDFLKELEKQKIKLSLSEQAEWMQYFEAEKSKANAIQKEIDTTDKEIDAMVYALYGLTEEEIAIVENA